MAGQTDYSGLAPQTQLVGTLPASSGAGTVIQLLNGAGYPTGATGIAFTLTLDRGSSTEEKILCSLRSGNNVTISQRGYDDTVAVDHASGAQINHTVDATILRTASAHIYDQTRDDHHMYPLLTGARAFTGAVTIASGGLTATGANVVAQSGAANAINLGTVGSGAGAGIGLDANNYLAKINATTWALVIGGTIAWQLNNGVMGFDSTLATAATATAGTGPALPATVQTFLKITFAGTTYKIPVYAN